MSPTYRNISKIRKTVNGKVIEPNEEFVSLVYFDENEIELKKIKDEPFYNPTIYSEKITEPTEIIIPNKDEFKNWISKYSIHFHVEKGEVKILYNDKYNSPALNLYEGCKWNERVLERKIDKLIITGTDGFILWVIVERL